MFFYIAEFLSMKIEMEKSLEIWNSDIVGRVISKRLVKLMLYRLRISWYDH